jgi:phage tail sheath protein FI
VVNNSGNEVDDITTFWTGLSGTSYGVLDSGYKYMYDRYNDLYRYIPLNGDVAGLCARTDQVKDPWWSPAGYNRGGIKNVVKLAWNPNKGQRDLLYPLGVNPFITVNGIGTVMFGDKTLSPKPSAFDRINVRRLFITIEKDIADAVKFFNFEFNDDFTRAQVINLITPYLKDVQGRRGVYDFYVVCDTTNNSPEDIDTNNLNVDVYVQPTKSINYINLNFTAVGTGQSFSSVTGQS